MAKPSAACRAPVILSDNHSRSAAGRADVGMRRRRPSLRADLGLNRGSRPDGGGKLVFKPKNWNSEVPRMWRFG